ncbi:hypothetical protein HMI54_001097 [Coelomomyces lativittatus]|nr:hypothetical protein HMI55_002224 [Coelomomyces lativittatus]KAJ1507258.1 hypothetical protein HMI56_000188 [Coelomomyces lativittatus]KAJ1511038.1 hypothetical protein HMI54_001097 [Coelomomyces lativittatus]
MLRNSSFRPFFFQSPPWTTPLHLSTSLPRPWLRSMSTRPHHHVSFTTSRPKPAWFPWMKWGTAVSVGWVTYMYLEPLLWVTVSAAVCFGTARLIERMYSRPSGSSMFSSSSSSTSTSTFSESPYTHFTLYKTDEHGRMRPIRKFEGSQK